MKKITFFVACFLLICFSGHSQVQVGFGTTTSSNTPFSPGNVFSYAQSIYLASEINASGSISSIQWYYTGTSPLSKSQQLTVYLATVPSTKTAFSSKTDWVTNLTQVYSGGITTGSQPGWVTINFPTPFPYNGVDNLVVAAHENMSDKDDITTDRFRVSSYTGARSIYATSPTADPDPASPPTATNTSVSAPNIILGGIGQACATPTSLTSSAITSSTATVSWTSTTDVHSLAGCDYYIFTSNVPPTSSTAPTKSIAAGTSAQITGLDPNTTYYVWVRNNCGSGLYSNWSEPVSFMTLCLPRTDFEEYFDLASPPSLPGCWSKILRGDSVSPAANVKTTSINSYTAANSLEITNVGSTGTYDVIAVSPLLSNLGDKTHRLRFYAKGDAGSLEVGTLNNNTSTASFTVLETITGITTNYAEFEVDFSKYNVSGQYIGIRLNAPVQTTINLDNVIWEQIPGCPNVTDLKVVEVSHNTATFGWTEAGVETSWDIAVGLYAETDPNKLPFTNTDSSGYFLAQGLAPTTKYKGWIRTVCDNGKGVWVGPVTFTTVCEPQPNFFEDFDSIVIPKPASGPRESDELPYCWSKIIRANNGVITPATKVGTSMDVNYVSGSVNSVFLQNKDSSGNFDMILVSPPVSSLQLKNHRLKFFSRTTGSGSVEIGTLNTNTDSGVFTLFKTVNFGTGTIEYVVDFTGYTGSDKFIGFRFPNSGGAFGGVSMDNITWEVIPTCPEVSNIAVTATTVSTADVKWSPSVPGTESSWDVTYGNLSDNNPDGLTAYNVSASLPAAYTFTGLSSGTSYNVWVRARCAASGSLGSWIGPVVFTTECAPIATFYETFDNVTLPDLPPCWSKILRGGTNLSIYAYIKTLGVNADEMANFTQPNYVQINPQPGTNAQGEVILVSPAVTTVGNLQKYRLKFDTFHGGPIQVGVLDGNTPAANFYVHQDIDLKYDSGQVIVDFSNYTGPIREYNHIGIKVKGGNSTLMNVDNIIWEAVPECADMVSKAKISMLSPTTATVKWDKAANETGWQVSVHPNNPVAADAIIKNVDDMPSPSVAVDGLVPGTNYNVWVRTYCGGNKYGSWSSPTSFMSPCLAVNLPYSLDFNDAVIPAVPACTSATSNPFLENFWQTSQTAGSYGFTSKNIRVFGGDTKADSWFFTQGVNLVAGINYKISYLIGTSVPGAPGPCAGTCGGSSSLKAFIGTSPTADGMSSTLKDYVNLVGPAAEDRVDFTVSTSGVYYFGFHNYSEGGHGSLSLDDILVDSSLGNGSFDLSTLTYYPNPVKDIMNISYTETIDSISVYNLLGQQMITHAVNNNQTKIDMSSLLSGAYFVKISAGSIVKTIKIIKE